MSWESDEWWQEQPPDLASGPELAQQADYERFLERLRAAAERGWEANTAIDDTFNGVFHEIWDDQLTDTERRMVIDELSHRIGLPPLDDKEPS